MECVICVEKLGKARKPVRCPYCQHEACHKCVERFLLGGTIAPKCMKCQTGWSMEFLRGVMTKSFMDKPHKQHQKDALLAEAESRIGDYQEHARLLDEEVRARARVEEAKRVLQERNAELARIRERLSTGGAGGSSGERREFFMACPHHDCRGQLSTAYKCGLCERRYCPQCHKEKQDDQHQCHADDLETVRMLRQNTKPCPKCHTGIYKTEGCDQMWCVQCHTCFSWRTGTILNGTIHNPHYYEYQRRINGGNAPRNPGDVPCGGMPSYAEISRRQRTATTQDDAWVTELHRTINELRDYAMPHAQQKFDYHEQHHTYYACQYLRNKINRAKWADLLYRRSKQEEKYRRHYQVLEMLTTSATEELIRYVRDKAPAADVRKSCEALFQYANDELAKMRRQYNMIVPNLAVGARFG